MSAILVARFAALMTCFWWMDGWELDRRAGGGLRQGVRDRARVDRSPGWRHRDTDDLKVDGRQDIALTVGGPPLGAFALPE